MRNSLWVSGSHLMVGSLWFLNDAIWQKKKKQSLVVRAVKLNGKWKELDLVINFYTKNTKALSFPPLASISLINQTESLLGGHTEKLGSPGMFSPSRYCFQPYRPVVSRCCNPTRSPERPQPRHRASLPVLPLPRENQHKDLLLPRSFTTWPEFLYSPWFVPTKFSQSEFFFPLSNKFFWNGKHILND